MPFFICVTTGVRSMKVVMDYGCQMRICWLMKWIDPVQNLIQFKIWSGSIFDPVQIWSGSVFDPVQNLTRFKIHSNMIDWNRSKLRQTVQTPNLPSEIIFNILETQIKMIYAEKAFLSKEWLCKWNKLFSFHDMNMDDCCYDEKL
jgi:hypothetical protein